MATPPLDQYDSTFFNVFTKPIIFTQAPRYALPYPATTPSIGMFFTPSPTPAYYTPMSTTTPMYPPLTYLLPTTQDDNLGRYRTQPQRKEMKINTTVEVKTKTKKRKSWNPNLYKEEIHLAIDANRVVTHIWPDNIHV
ncbi:hypothetical protein PVK06_008844 [Gossypium arboreum]|uniref:Uncharacterized protein n=1 Tax=Gossypium arboreum TaxID=29729 RepID=A0ABR0QL78_GOSAR|nr:hypothetical protein PVK06_008844 [Gossypium arboreum]